MIRVVLPAHLRTLAKTGREVSLEIAEPATIGAVVDALEANYPMLKGTIRDSQTGQRRALIRFFVSGQDWSHESMDKPLPADIVGGSKPLMVVGAIAGG